MQVSSVTTFYLNNLRTPLSSLLKANDTNIISIDESDDFIEFIYYAIYNYHDHDLNLFWELIEALMKSKLLNYDCFVNNFKFKVDETVGYACTLNLICLMKTLLKAHVIKIEAIKNGCLICIRNDFHIIFKLLLSELSKSSLNLTSLLIKAIEKERISYVQLIFDLFPVRPNENSLGLFEAICRKNLEIIRLLLSRNLNFGIYSESGLNFMEMAVKFNFVEAVELLSKVNNNYFLCTTVLKVAVYYKSHESLDLLLSLITENGSLNLDQIYSKNAISNLLRDSLIETNSIALDKILENLESVSIEDFKFLFEDWEENVVYPCNLIHYSIIIGNEDGFEILLTHFGIESLKILNANGLNSFLLAVKYENLYLINRIAELCSELVDGNK